MTTLELANPFTEAQIIGPSNGSYHRQTVKRGDPAFIMSKSELWEFAKCPSRWIAGYKAEKTSEMSWGDRVDCLLFTPDRFAKRFVVCPATYPAAKGEVKPWNWNAIYCKDWRDSQPAGVEVLKPDEAEEIQLAVHTLKQDDDVRELLSCSQSQVEIAAEYHDESGIVVPLRGLVDIAPNAPSERFGKCLADLKTCESAHPKPFARSVHQYGYAWQAAIYLDIWTAATEEDRCEFRFILQESFAPYQVGKRILSQEFLEIGRRDYIAALRLYCQCLNQNDWPNYEGMDNQSIDGWAITQPEAWMIC